MTKKFTASERNNCAEGSVYYIVANATVDLDINKLVKLQNLIAPGRLRFCDRGADDRIGILLPTGHPHASWFRTNYNESYAARNREEARKTLGLPSDIADAEIVAGDKIVWDAWIKAEKEHSAWVQEQIDNSLNLEDTTGYEVAPGLIRTPG